MYKSHVHVHNICNVPDILGPKCPHVASGVASHLRVSVISMFYLHIPHVGNNWATKIEVQN